MVLVFLKLDDKNQSEALGKAQGRPKWLMPLDVEVRKLEYWNSWEDKQRSLFTAGRRDWIAAAYNNIAQASATSSEEAKWQSLASTFEMTIVELSMLLATVLLFTQGPLSKTSQRPKQLFSGSSIFTVRWNTQQKQKKRKRLLTVVYTASLWRFCGACEGTDSMGVRSFAIYNSA